MSKVYAKSRARQWAIFNARQTKSTAEVADEFGVTCDTVNSICRNLTPRGWYAINGKRYELNDRKSILLLRWYIGLFLATTQSKDEE